LLDAGRGPDTDHDRRFLSLLIGLPPLLINQILFQKLYLKNHKEHREHRDCFICQTHYQKRVLKEKWKSYQYG